MNSPKNHEVEETDRLSDNPDAILLHILSSLCDTKQCVQTSVLSKRWRCLWASLPDLFFHGREYGNLYSLRKVLLHVLSRRNNLPLTKFSFHYALNDKSIISKAIEYAVSHNVQDLNLLFIASFKHLSPHLNNCRSLKTLTLHTVFDLRLLQNLTLPCLTTLYVRHSSFSNVNEPTIVSVDPFVGLVSLKTLHLNPCFMYGINNFKITAPQLDALDLRIVRHICKVEIFAPKLRFFSFRNQFSDIHLFDMFSNLDFPLLEMADIDSSIPQQSLKKSFLHMINVFHGLNHVRSLVLSAPLIEGLIMNHPGVVEDIQASPFVRLKTLKVKYPPYPRRSFNIIAHKIMNYFCENVTIEKI